MSLLKINDLSVVIDGKSILNGTSLLIEEGSIHALMGPNGSGKSTLAYTLLGHPSCTVTNGTILFDGQDITDLSVEKRARLGIFFALQYPHEVPGLNVFTFLKEIYTAFTGKQITVSELKILVETLLEKLNLDINFLDRSVNHGFSGGEKKRFEVLQLLLLNPRLAIIDEIDSGLDVDSLRCVALALNELKANNPEFTVVLVTHYQRILDYINPDYVHIFFEGKVIKSGSFGIVSDLEKQGYDEFVRSYKESEI